MSATISENHELLSRLPEIESSISCEGWPAADKLLALTRQTISATIRAAGLKLPEGAVLSLLFTDDDEICTLNGNFRNIRQPTNVLSFPGSTILPGEMPDRIMGDLAFALQTIEREAALENKQFHHHLSHLIVHGFLHLLGYDHIKDNDAAVMELLETKTLALLGIPDPYMEQ